MKYLLVSVYLMSGNIAGGAVYPVMYDDHTACEVALQAMERAVVSGPFGDKIVNFCTTIPTYFQSNK